MKRQRHRGAVASKLAIDQLDPAVKAARAQHAVMREWAQRRADAQANLKAVEDVFARTQALLPEAEAAVEAAKVTLAEIERQNVLMAG